MKLGLEKKHDLLNDAREFFSSLIFKPLKKIMRKLNSQSQNFIRPSIYVYLFKTEISYKNLTLNYLCIEISK